VIGLSILSGSHITLVGEILERLRASGLGDVPLIVGGIIPESDARKMEAAGVAAVFTPKDFGLTEIMHGIVAAIRRAHDLD
jgi:(2R)-ethylmalonyl-CoA mutase